MATFTLVPLPRIGITPEAGSLIYTYSAGGSTPAATYQDSNGIATNTNPVQADGNGLFPAIYLPLGTSYKFIATHAITNGLPADPLFNVGTVIWTQDGIASVPASTPAVDMQGTAGETLLANAAVYLSDGSGGKQAGLWYNADSTNAYSSVTPYVGFATLGITTGAVGTIRLQGSLAGFVSLSVGPVYIGVGGNVTVIPGINSRLIGQADTTTSVLVGGNPPSAPISFVNDFRLSLTTAVPITIADVTAAGTLFLTPYSGNRITLFNANGGPTTYQSAEMSIAIPATVSKVFDVWCFASAGVPTLELLAWTSDTVRGTAIARTNGRLTKSGDLTRLYIGSIRTTAVANQTEDSFAKRYVWNYYNRVPRVMRVLETTASWAYNGVFRQANGAATNQLDFVLGVAEVPVEGYVVANVSGNASGFPMWVSIGEDSTTTPDAAALNTGQYTLNAGSPTPVLSQLKKYPAVGRHIWAWLEKGGAATITFYGNNSGDGTQSGIHGSILG